MYQMCGIFALLDKNGYRDNNALWDKVQECFAKGSNRGPEECRVHLDRRNNIFLGFHRLAINGFGRPESAQPLTKEDCVLICNGEIYNWEYLSALSGCGVSSGSDCEIIIHLYKKYGIEQTLQMLDGVFAFLLYDKTLGKIIVARDTYGVRPLFMSTATKKGDNDVWQRVFSSELKMLYPFCESQFDPKSDTFSVEIKQFPPGHYMCCTVDNYNTDAIVQYSTPNSFSGRMDVSMPFLRVREALISAVSKRIVNTDRDITCLLSGGLDSSLITGLVVQLCKEILNREASTIHTWSIGMNGSEDLKYAKKVAEYLGTTHHSIELEEEEFLNAIPEVIYAIESDDTTTVRASVGNWLVSKYIKEMSDAKVVFNGDGSDEICGGYMYFHAAPDPIAFDQECRRLLRDIHFFDVLRSDRSISSHGLEARTPFLDRFFVQTYLSLPAALRCHNVEGNCEKFLLRTAFAPLKLIPDEVLWRTKEAFSDGVSKQARSWFEVIQDYASTLYPDKTGLEAEKAYYSSIYKKYYGDTPCTPYKWMPKFVDATDASARTLNIYKKMQSH